jgi:hypothetical protein
MPDSPVDEVADPLFFPKDARMLLVWKALESWASRPGSGADPAQYAAKYEQALSQHYTRLATAYNRQTRGDGKWWTLGDLIVGPGYLNT